MSNVAKLAPENMFPGEAFSKSVQIQPEPNSIPSLATLVFQFATAADVITPWGVDQKRRDQQLREFWPSEPYLAGAIANVSFRNASEDWEIQHASDAIVQAVTEMLMRASTGDKIGWTDFVKKFSQDLYTTDNGAFIELIRDEGMDANSKFKGPMAPVIGIASIDSNQCTRTGNAEFPVVYTDREGKLHKLHWWEIIPFSDFPSAIEKMNGVGYCSVTRSLRLAQIMKSTEIFKDEKISGRNIKDIHIVGGVSKTALDDAVKRTKEQANNMGNMRFIENAILASLDPEKPVSVATVELASLPEGFDEDKMMVWYIGGLALNLGVDYQELAPLPGGGIGSGNQSDILSKKSRGKGPRNWMDSITQSFVNYGVLPRGAKMVFNDKSEQEEAEKQKIRTGAMEEAAMAANSRIMPRKKIAENLVERGIFKNLDDIPEDFWKDDEPMPGQPVGSRGGNTIREDTTRRDNSKPDEKTGGRLRKAWNELFGQH